MRRSSQPALTPLFAGLLTALLLTAITIPLGAQSAPDSRFMNAPYDRAHEIAAEGAIQKIFSTHVSGSPVGVHLLISAPQGLVDAHLGAMLSPATMALLHSGDTVKVVGAMKTIDGKPYLLVRQLTVGGETITIRNPRGFLARSGGLRSSQMGNNGGGR